MKKLLFALLWSGFASICLIEAGQPTTSIAPSAAIPAKTPSENEGIILFTPPANWLRADSNILPTHVRVMVVGKAPSSFPPSLNLSCEPYQGTLKQYLKIVKNMNAAKGYEWKDLGNIQTQAGIGNLSQVDTKTQWGDVRLMHVILIKNGNVYILTASALKEEFSIFYNQFFAAMRSLRIAKDIYEIVTNSQQRIQLKNAAHQLQLQWQALLVQKQQEDPQLNQIELGEKVFNSEEFQNTIWKPFQEMLNQKYKQWGAEWCSLFLQKLEDQLLTHLKHKEKHLD
jgi:hypothetical protein